MGKLTIESSRCFLQVQYVHIPVCEIPLVFTMYDQLIRIYVVVVPILHSSTCTINLWLSKP